MTGWSAICRAMRRMHRSCRGCSTCAMRCRARRSCRRRSQVSARGGACRSGAADVFDKLPNAERAANARSSCSPTPSIATSSVRTSMLLSRCSTAAGYRVHLAKPLDGSSRPLCCGRTFLSVGTLDEARKEAKRTLAARGTVRDARGVRRRPRAELSCSLPRRGAGDGEERSAAGSPDPVAPSRSSSRARRPRTGSSCRSAGRSPALWSTATAIRRRSTPLARWKPC